MSFKGKGSVKRGKKFGIRFWKKKGALKMPADLHVCFHTSVNLVPVGAGLSHLLIVLLLLSWVPVDIIAEIMFLKCFEPSNMLYEC